MFWEESEGDDEREKKREKECEKECEKKSARITTTLNISRSNPSKIEMIVEVTTYRYPWTGKTETSV